MRSSAFAFHSEIYDSGNQLPLFNEPLLYHKEDSCGFFALCHKEAGKLKQKSHRLSDLEFVISSVDRTRDTYLSQGEFSQPNRRIVNLARLGLCFLDLDTYNTRWRDHTHEQFIGAILQYCNDEGLPEPMILSSGRGYYLKWVYNRAIPEKALPRWNALQSALCNLFSDYGADPAAKDASRILRLEHTVNSKNGQICKVIHTPAHHHDFESLCRELLPRDRHELRTSTATKADARLELIQGGGKVIPGLRRLGIMSLHWSRIRDLKTLAALRGGIQLGDRDKWMFTAVCSLAWIIAPGQLYQEVLAMCRHACPSMRPEDIHAYSSSAIKRAEQSATTNKESRYKLSNRYLIEMLRITPAEEAQLSTIISKTEKAERHRKQNRKNSDRKTYLEPVDQRRTEARLRSAKGESQRQIAQALGVSRGAVENYLRD